MREATTARTFGSRVEDSIVAFRDTRFDGTLDAIPHSSAQPGWENTVPCLEPCHHPEFALTTATNEEMSKLSLCWEPSLLRSLAWEILLTPPSSTAILMMWLEQHFSACLQREPQAACRREGEGVSLS